MYTVWLDIDIIGAVIIGVRMPTGLPKQPILLGFNLIKGLLAQLEKKMRAG